MAKKVIDICAVCRKDKELTFEHSPHRAAFNDSQVRMQDFRHIVLTEENKYLYGKSKKSNRGLGNYSLCEECNNFIGANYCESYIDLVYKLDPIIEQTNGFVRRSEIIRPLNFIKQVLVMLLCADRPVGSISSLINSEEFILNIESKMLKKEIKIYMYATMSSEHRAVGLSVLSLNGIIGRYAECNYHPFGFLLADDSPKTHPALFDISHFATFEYNERAIIDFNLPKLVVKGLTIGTYG